MALTNELEQNFADFYTKIAPYLNGGGIGLKLLWENANPTQNVVNGDTASLSSDDYDLALYIAKRSTSDQREAACVVCVKGDNGLFSFSMSGISYFRVFNVSGTTVTFGSGAAGSSVEESICIPYRIYGIKVYNSRDVPGKTTLLWSNPDPSSSFASQDITLANSDYSILKFIFKTSSTSNYCLSIETKKGYGTALRTVTQNGMQSRLVDYVSDAKYTFGDGELWTYSGTPSTVNTILIPLEIYGIKL